MGAQMRIGIPTTPTPEAKIMSESAIKFERMSNQDIRLLLGELTAQEMRTARAILAWVSREVERELLDARRQGMLDAAEIAAKKSAIMPHYSDVERGYAQGRGEASQEILKSADALDRKREDENKS